MSEHKLNLSEAVRLAKRKRVNEINRIRQMPPQVYLLPGKSNIGRNKAKRMRRGNEQV